MKQLKSRTIWWVILGLACSVVLMGVLSFTALSDTTMQEEAVAAAEFLSDGDSIVLEDLNDDDVEDDNTVENDTEEESSEEKVEEQENDMEIQEPADGQSEEQPDGKAVVQKEQPRARGGSLSDSLMSKGALLSKKKPYNVVLYQGVGASNRSWQNTKEVLQCFKNDFKVRMVRTISDEALRRTKADVVFIPGGLAQLIGGSHRKKGINLKAVISRFLRRGGGYVGVCAGAFLGGRSAFAISPHVIKHSLMGVGFINDVVFSKNFTQLLPMSENLGNRMRFKTIFYANGPIYGRKMQPDPFMKDASAPMALVRVSEKGKLKIKIESDKEKRKVSNLPIVVTNKLGRGRVVLSGVHPETDYHAPLKPASKCRSPQAQLLRQMVLVSMQP